MFLRSVGTYCARLNDVIKAAQHISGKSTKRSYGTKMQSLWFQLPTNPAYRQAGVPMEQESNLEYLGGYLTYSLHLKL